MKKLDWYIIKKFLVSFIFCMIAITTIAVAVDTSEKADDFVKTELSNWDIFTKYYLGFIPWIMSLLFPLFAFIAVIFFTSKMAMRSEVIAILASGTTFNRFLRPYLIGGTLLALVLFLGRRYVVPQANVIQTEFKKDYLDKNDGYKSATEARDGVCTDCFYKRIDSSTYMGVKSFNAQTQSGGLFFMDRVGKNGKLVYNLRAQSIRWDTAGGKGRGRWLAQNVVERKIDSLGEDVTHIAEKHVVLKILPEELIRDEYLKEKLTTPELIRFIEREKLRGTEGLNSLQVERFKRSATPFTVILLTFIGAVLACRKTRGGSGLHLALGIIIAAIFVIADQFSTVFAVKGNFPPVLAAWIPNLVFSIVALRLYQTTPK